MYVTPREMIVSTCNEADRILRFGGFLVITDFDTPGFCKRENKHNKEMPVYKENYAQRFLRSEGGYTLVEKRMYTHQTDCFGPDIQQRVSTQILYKEYIQDLYLDA